MLRSETQQRMRKLTIMGNFSKNTFDKMKQYVNVRLQQGVPILDADWNEQDDIRKSERQAFIRDFIGDGVPPGSDAFLIRQAGDNGGKNDFEIVGGEGTDDDTKRCLVDGWDVFNPNTRKYQDQLLYGDDGVALADKWDVAPLPELQAPDEERTDTVYLDIWEVEVDANEDENIIDQNVGVETCVHLKRVWVVRVAEDTDPESLSYPEDGHVFYPLAKLVRSQDNPAITDDQITDLRTTAGSKAFESEWIEQEDDGEKTVGVGFRPRIVSVIAQVANGSDYDDQYTQISPAKIGLDGLNTDETCFTMTSSQVTVHIKIGASMKIRFKVYAW